ncbi:unnamed protein product [Brugia timori]|uniref:7TM_GPCR_Srx domain-containing protein n=1 Tax=Brugia timori TaxID=42155 RepID=A0A0R3RC48_9BILA|nr:unnamed protein product [Brugia timori]
MANVYHIQLIVMVLMIAVITVMNSIVQVKILFTITCFTCSLK